MSFQVVFSREAVLRTIDCIRAIAMRAVEATAIVLRLVSKKILLARECNSTSEAGWFKTAMLLAVVLLMFVEPVSVCE